MGLLTVALEEDIARVLLDVQFVTAEVVEQMVRRLEINRGLPPASAKWAVDSLLTALGLGLSASPEVVQTQPRPPSDRASPGAQPRDHAARARHRRSAVLVLVSATAALMIGAALGFALQARDAERAEPNSLGGTVGHGSTTTISVVPTLPTLAAGPAISEDFADGFGWANREDDDWTRGVVDGQYQLAARKLHTRFSQAAPRAGAAGRVKVEVDAVMVSKATTGGFGVTCDSDRDSYLGDVSLDGSWRIRRSTGSGTSVLAAAGAPDTYVEAVRPGVVRRIGMECTVSEPHRTSTVKLFVDGRQVGTDVLQPDGELVTRTSLAVTTVDEPLDVRFDNFVLTRL